MALSLGNKRLQHTVRILPTGFLRSSLFSKHNPPPFAVALTHRDKGIGNFAASMARRHWHPNYTVILGNFSPPIITGLSTCSTVRKPNSYHHIGATRLTMRSSCKSRRMERLGGGSVRSTLFTVTRRTARPRENAQRIVGQEAHPSE